MIISAGWYKFESLQACKRPPTYNPELNSSRSTSSRRSASSEGPPDASVCCSATLRSTGSWMSARPPESANMRQPMVQAITTADLNSGPSLVVPNPRWIDHPSPRQHRNLLKQSRFRIGVFGQKRPSLCFVTSLHDQHAADHPLAIGGQKWPADLDAIGMGFQEVEMGRTVGEPRLKPVRTVQTQSNKVHRSPPRAQRICLILCDSPSFW